MQQSALRGGIIALIIILVIVLLYALTVGVEWEILGPPADCTKYLDKKGADTKLSGLCSQAKKYCGYLTGRDSKACDAAVGSCMVSAEAAYKLHEAKGHPTNPDGTPMTPVQQFNSVAQHIPSCIRAMGKVSPEGLAKAYNAHQKGGGGGGLPPEVYSFFSDEEARKNIREIASLTPPLVEWGMEIGKDIGPQSS